MHGISYNEVRCCGSHYSPPCFLAFESQHKQLCSPYEVSSDPEIHFHPQGRAHWVMRRPAQCKAQRKWISDKDSGRLK